MRLTRPLAVVALIPLLAACPGVDSAGPSTCSGPLPYAAGTTISGTTSAGSNFCKAPDGSNSMMYNFTVPNGGGLKLTVAANGFPPHIGLYTTDKKVIAESNDGSMPAYLPAGNYLLAVSSTSNADGTYTLTSPTFVHTGCVANVITVRGMSISGTLATSDCPLATSGPTIRDHRYSIRGISAGTPVSITYTVDRVMGFNLVGSCSVNKEMSGAGSGVITCTSTGNEIALNIESRTFGTNLNLPVNYTVTIN